MSGRILNVKLTEFYNLSGNVINIDVAAGVTSVVDFVGRFNGIAKSVLIDNLDAANVALYRLNSRSAEQRQVRANSTRVLTVPIELIEIIAGAAGAVQITAEVIPLSLIERSQIDAVQ